MHRTLAGNTCVTLLGSGQYLAGLAGSHNISSLSPPNENGRSSGVAAPGDRCFSPTSPVQVPGTEQPLRCQAPFTPFTLEAAWDHLGEKVPWCAHGVHLQHVALGEQPMVGASGDRSQRAGHPLTPFLHGLPRCSGPCCGRVRGMTSNRNCLLLNSRRIVPLEFHNTGTAPWRECRSLETGSLPCYLAGTGELPVCCFFHQREVRHASLRERHNTVTQPRSSFGESCR